MHLTFVKTKELSQIINLFHWVIGLMDKAQRGGPGKGFTRQQCQQEALLPLGLRALELSKSDSVCYFFVAGDL